MRNPSTERVSVLFTDLYELTMAASYFKERMFEPATFSLFIRRYPTKNWAYFVNAGLDEALAFLEQFHFTDSEIDYLKSTGMFADDFLDYLRTLRFTGDVWAMKEGEIFFEDEPVLEVTGPIIEAQLVETFLLNTLHLQSLICTKATRAMLVAHGKALVDFSLRRTHGRDAGLKVARSCHIAGFKATSNVLAGYLYGIPTSGTMAHSYVTAFEEEIDAFRAFVRAHPDNAILLIDTYDTLSGAKKAAEVGREMKERGQTLRGVRLDSGDMASLSRKVRRILDDAGLKDTLIFASSGFDEYKIHKVLSRGARIDGFGVGTNMGVSEDAPSSDMAYKMVAYAGRPVLKLSTGKLTLPAEKQVFRAYDRSGRFRRDTIALRDETIPGADPLLCKVMESGRRLFSESLDEARARCAESLKRLPKKTARVVTPEHYRVEQSRGLRKLTDAIKGKLEKQII
ncbi:MAG: nicotinate phosphoribosyltransferase [Candidatus Abyssubacteria bacterium]